MRCPTTLFLDLPLIEVLLFHLSFKKGGTNLTQSILLRVHLEVGIDEFVYLTVHNS